MLFATITKGKNGTQMMIQTLLNTKNQVRYEKLNEM